MSTNPLGGRVGALLDRLRQPEYTGENRCTPCTIVNLVIATVVAAGLWLLAAPVGVGVPVAGAFLVIALAAIYVRGYLVPGTPTLTKRYFPERVLRWFDKAEVNSGVGGDAGGESLDEDDGAAEIQPEAVMFEAGAIEECADGEDLCLEASFQEAWRARNRELRDELSVLSAFADVIGIDEDRLRVRDAGGKFVAHVKDAHGIQWPSEAAYVADVAAGQVLEEQYAGWDALAPNQRVAVLEGLRLFLEQCPACDGPVSFGEDVVESCCRSIDVVAVTCEECGTRLFELEQPSHVPEDVPDETATAGD